MMRKKQIPRFESEEQEQGFWATHDSSDYLDWSKARRITFSNLKPSTLKPNHNLLDEVDR
jgi:hypothetical protein